jgi:hypothetical protein
MSVCFISETTPDFLHFYYVSTLKVIALVEFGSYQFGIYLLYMELKTKSVIIITIPDHFIFNIINYLFFTKTQIVHGFYISAKSATCIEVFLDRVNI